MKRAAFFTLLAVACLSGSGEIFACGDKFLVGNSGQTIPRLQPNMQLANIAIFRNADPALIPDGWNTNYEETLVAAGHTVWVIPNPDALEQELQTGGFDLLITDMEAAAALRREVQSAGDAAVLPFMKLPTRAEFKEAKAEYGRVLKVPTNATQMLTVVAKTLAGH